MPEERAFSTWLCFGALTYWQTLVYYLNEVSHEPLQSMSKYVQSVLAIGVFQLYYADSVPAYAAVDTSVELASYFAGIKVRALTNALLRQLERKRPPLPKRTPGLAYGWSNELFGIVRRSYGEEVALAIAEHSVTSPQETTVRLNRTRVDAELPDDSLAPEIQVTKGRFMEPARDLFLHGRSPLKQRAYTEGLMSLQNESSQLAVHLALEHKPKRVLDLCSGHGGKTAAFREWLPPDASLTALEIDPEKVLRNKENLARLGLSGTRLLVGDATATIEELEQEAFDLVFCDVPCSGLGVLHKKPEIKLRQTYERIMELVALQKQILDRAASYVATGGYLFYVTCTHNKSENEEQVERFLDSHRDFCAASFSRLPEGIKAIEEKGHVNLFSYRDGIDGLFIQALKRESSAARSRQDGGT